MPKLIAPRRTSKNLSADEYWKLRHSFQKQQPNRQLPAREQQVNRRHRYERLSHQLLNFNPNSYFIDNAEQKDQLKTNYESYLQRIRYRLPEEIMSVKSMMLGLASVLQNLHKIYQVLWAHLECEDSWGLMRALLKDTKNESYSLWIGQGLSRIVQNLDTNFSLLAFQRIFNTLCVFHQNCYQSIEGDDHNYLEVMCRTFLRHRNKYIRYFSVRSLSYVLQNFGEEHFGRLIIAIDRSGRSVCEQDQLQNEGHYLYEKLGEIISQRLKYTQQCLTTNSLHQLINMLNFFTSSDLSEPTYASFICSTLSNLQQLKPQQQTNNLYDTYYIMKCLIEAQTRTPNPTLAISIITAFHEYLSTVPITHKKCNKHYKTVSQPLKQLICKYLWDKLLRLRHSKPVYDLLIYSMEMELSALDEIRLFLQQQQNLSNILYFLQALEKGGSYKVSNLQFIVYTFSKHIIQYLSNFYIDFTPQQQQTSNLILYHIFLRCKQKHIIINLNTLITTNNTDLIQQCLHNLLLIPKKQLSYQYCLIVLRILSILRFMYTDAVVDKLRELFDKLLRQYCRQLSQYVSSDQSIGLYKQIFQYKHYTEQILLYSFQSVDSVISGFVLFHAFLELQNQSSSRIVNEELSSMEIWNILCQHTITNNSNKRHSYSLNMKSLRLRHRTIRYNNLQKLRSLFPHLQILPILAQIDQQDIGLDNQRQVKRLLEILYRKIDKDEVEVEEYEVMVNWAIGFSFTGFKLISTHYAKFANMLMQKCPEELLGVFLKFVAFCTFRNSRVYEQEANKLFNNSKLATFSQCSTVGSINKLISQDFQLLQIQSFEYLGIERITHAISLSKRAKERFGDKLINLIDSYFRQEFFRVKNTITHIILSNNHKSHIGVNLSNLIPKTPFLLHILKILPDQYTPPYQCLHYTAQALKYGHFRAIKNQQWQLSWQSKLKKEQKQINFEIMSIVQKQVYLNFLWGEMLKSNSDCLRIIIQHIRDRMPEMVDYLTRLLYNEMVLGYLEKQEQAMFVFRSVGEKRLLTYMYIMKAMVKGLGLHLREQTETVFKLIEYLVRVSFAGGSDNLEGEDEQKLGLGDNIGGQQHQEQYDKQENISTDNNNDRQLQSHKNVRKQLYKLLTTSVRVLHETTQQNIIEHILNLFTDYNRISKIGQHSQNSPSGLLNFLVQLSQYPKYHHLILNEIIISQLCMILSYGASNVNMNSVNLSIEIITNLLGISQSMIDQQTIVIYQCNLSKLCIISGNCLLDSLLRYLTFKNSNTQQYKSMQNFCNVSQITVSKNLSLLNILKIAQKIIPYSSNISIQWGNYLVLQLQRILKQKNHSERSATKLKLILKTLMGYIIKNSHTQFLIKLIYLIPNLKDIEYRHIISENIIKSTTQQQINNNLPVMGHIAPSIVQNLNKFQKDSLTKQIDYQCFFEGINKYRNEFQKLTIIEHQFVLYNLLAYIDTEEYSVRKAINSSLSLFLSSMTNENKQTVGKMFRFLSDQLRKPSVMGLELGFWSVLGAVGHFVRWVVEIDRFNTEEYSMFQPFVMRFSAIDDQNDFEKHKQRDVFEQLCALSQNKKFEGLKNIRKMLQSSDSIIRNQPGDKYPNIISHIIVPVLDHLIIPAPIHRKQYNVQTNLGSTLSHVSLQLYKMAMKRGGESMQKKSLKRLMSKLKFDDSHIKNNIIIIKIIGSIMDSIDLPISTATIRKMIDDSGFDQFHKKIVEKQCQFSKMNDESQPSDDEQAVKKIAFASVNKELSDEQLLNMNYLDFDRKLMQAQQQENMQAQFQEHQQNSIIKFIRNKVLNPLKTMLMYQNKSSRKSEQENDKSRMYLSVVITKIILKLPLDAFITQIQKVVSKLGRLLKKRSVDVRDNARKCVAQIAKITGPEMLYLIFRELKFHLRDNFQNHVLNFTIYYILEKVGKMTNGALDHCLPIILPAVVDEIFGKAALEKQMVEEGLAPTINMQSRKRKGNMLLGLICNQISTTKIQYLLKYLHKFLKEYLDSEANLNKFDVMLNSLISGLTKNESLKQEQNGLIFIKLLYELIEELKGQIKLYKFDQQANHEPSTKQSTIKHKKTSLKQTYQLQQQTGRNGSIFKKQATILQQHRNHQIQVQCFMQFYLSLVTLLIKKQIVSPEVLRQSPQTKSKFSAIVSFTAECIAHRDNRLVNRCLKIVHYVINWEELEGVGQLRKNICRRVFMLMEKLTGADDQLLKECFTLLNDIISKIVITRDTLPTIINIIKLHIESAESSALEEPYCLFRTVLYKLSGTALLMDKNIEQLYTTIRVTMINAKNQQVRGACRAICLIYVRQTSTSTDFKKQLSFYLNNLDCKYPQTQLCILDTIEEIISNINKSQIQQVGEIIIMALGTAYANDSYNQCKLTQIIQFVINKIDKSKTLQLLDKAAIWASDSNKLLSKCGLFIIWSVISLESMKVSQEVSDKIKQLCVKILEKQCVNVSIQEQQDRQSFRNRQIIKQNPQWKNVLQSQSGAKDVEVLPSYGLCVKVISNWGICDKPEIIQLLWRLIGCRSLEIFNQTCDVFKSVKNWASAIGQALLSLQKEQKNSLKNKTMQIISNYSAECSEVLSTILKKIFVQITQSDNLHQICQNICLSLLIRIGRSVLNLKKNDNVMRLGFDFLIVILSFHQQLKHQLVNDEILLKQLLWNIAKISRNQMICVEIKEKNESIAELVKEVIGEAEFYRKFAQIEATRKQNKVEDKIKMARLAITDQQAYQHAKAKKKHKK